MPGATAQPQWNPVSEFKQAWPNAGLSDSQILSNLQDPSKFKSAFPHYTGVTDDEIRTKMAAYAPAKPAPTVAPSTLQEPSFMDKAKQAVFGPKTFLGAEEPGTSYSDFAKDPVAAMKALPGAIKDLANKPVVDISAFGPQKPITMGGAVQKAGSEFASGLTTPTNIAIMGATGGLGLAGKAGSVAQRLISGGFSLQMIKGAYDQYAPFKDAMDRGDATGAMYHLTHAVLGGAMATVAGQHAAVGDPSVPQTQEPKDPGQVFAQRQNANVEVSKPLPPKQVGEGTSAVALADQPRKIIPAQEVQSQTSEIARMQEVLNSPLALPEEKAYAKQAMQASQDLRDQIATTAAKRQASDPTIPTHILPEELLALQSDNAPAISDQKRGEAAAYVAQTLQPKMQADFAPEPPKEGLSGLTPDQQNIATDAIKRIITKATAGVPADDQPLRKLVEDAGGKWRGTDSMGLAHYDAPPSMVGDRDNVSIASPISKMNKDFIQSEFQRKSQEFAGTVSPTPGREVPQTLELPTSLNQSVQRLAQLAIDKNHATNDVDRLRIENKQQLEIANTSKLVRDTINGLPDEHLSALRDYVNKIADTNEKQAQYIKDRVKQHNTTESARQQMVEMRSVGYSSETTRIDPDTGEEQPVIKEAQTAPLSRSIMDQLQDRAPRVKISDLVIRQTPKGMTDDAWQAFSTKLRNRLQADHDSILRDAQIGADTNQSLEELHIPERLQELDKDARMLGKFPAAPRGPGRRPNISSTELIAPYQGISLDESRRMLGRKVRQIPTENEFAQHADKLNEIARVHKSISAAIDAKIGLKPVRQPERGAVGESVATKPIVDAKEVEPKKIIDSAKAAGFVTEKLQVDKPFSYAGWLSNDGKDFIKLGTGRDHTHAMIAESVLPSLASDLHDVASNALLEHGWIRKVSPNEYESHVLDSKRVNNIENEMIKSGSYGQATIIDTKDGLGKVRAIRLEAGWGDRHSNLGEAIDAEKARIRFPQAGSTATEMLAGGTIGAAIGLHIGGPIGGGIGWTVGMVTPAFIRSAPVRAALPRMFGYVNSIGLKPLDWLNGPKQDPIINPDMKGILDIQARDIRADRQTFAQRLGQLPGKVQVGLLDKFANINDQTSAAVKYVRKMDSSGKAFRDVSGKVSVEDSPWVTAWMAASGLIPGNQEVHMLDYRGVMTDAAKGGVYNNLMEYLNLKGYQRVYDVLNEHQKELYQEHQAMVQKLAQPNLGVRDRIQLEDRRDAARDQLIDLKNKMQSGEVTPFGYDEPKIKNELQTLQQQMAPAKFQAVQDLAKRVFAVNRKTLDILHDNEVISDANYGKYVARGDEYIPMHRIMSDLASYTAERQGSNSPLYLKQQNAVKALQGSERVNRNPLVASADASLLSIKEAFKNKTANNLVKLAGQFPREIGQYFKKVPRGTQASADHGIIGVYEKGVPTSYEVPKYISDALENVSSPGADTAISAAARWNRDLFRAGATTGNLSFNVGRTFTNLARLAVLSEARVKIGPEIIKDTASIVNSWLRNIHSSAVKDGAWQEFMRAGAGNSGLQSLINPEEFLDTKSLGVPSKLNHSTVLTKLEDWNRNLENGIKMTAYQRLRQNGWAEKSAAWETRQFGGAPDYARMGAWSKGANLAFMFVNANIRHLTSTFEKLGENPKGAGMALAGVTMMAMALNEWNQSHKDANGQPLMRRVSTDERERNFVILTGGTHITATGAEVPNRTIIRKPDFMKYVYNPIEDSLNKMMGREDRDGYQIALDNISNLLPIEAHLQEGHIPSSLATGAASTLNPILKTPIEEFANTQVDTYGNRPIVPARLQKLDPSQQFNTRTSPLARQVGQGGIRGAEAGFGMGATVGGIYGGLPGAALGGAIGAGVGAYGPSPLRVEHTLREGTAGIGEMATSALSPLVGGDLKQPFPIGTEGNRRLPVIGPAIARMQGAEVNQQELNLSNRFYEGAQKAQVAYNTFANLLKTNPDGANAYFQSHRDDIWKGSLSTKMQSQISKIDSAERMVQNDTSLPPQQRQQLLRNIDESRTQILKAYNSMFIGVTPRNTSSYGTGNALSQGTTGK